MYSGLVGLPGPRDSQASQLAIPKRAQALVASLEAERMYAHEVVEDGKEFVMLRAVPTFI